MSTRAVPVAPAGHFSLAELALLWGRSPSTVVGYTARPRASTRLHASAFPGRGSRLYVAHGEAARFAALYGFLAPAGAA